MTAARIAAHLQMMREWDAEYAAHARKWYAALLGEYLAKPRGH